MVLLDTEQQEAHLPAQPSLDDIERIFEQQQTHRQQLRQTTAAQRIAKLKRLRAAVIARREAIVDARYRDLRVPAVEADVIEVMSVVTEANFTIKHLHKWMQPKRIKASPLFWGIRSEIRYEPKGTTLIISPWNYPFALTLRPLISAIAAGCTAIIKPSEHSPHSAQVLQEIVADVFDAGEAVVIQGDATIAQTLLKLPFNHIYFTGSPEIGKLVMKAAAEHLASVTLELGGKSPTIVDDTVDVRKAAEMIGTGKFWNSGQVCIAPDYVLVHERVHDDFVRAVQHHLNTVFGATANDRQRTAHYGRIVNERHQQRIQRLVESAVAQGAQLVEGDIDSTHTRYIPPTVLTNVPPNAQIMHEEIFGPLMPIVKYRSLDDAIAYINSKPNPLALFVFSQNKQNIERVVSNTTVGSTCVNEIAMHFLHPELPFGGAGASGIGRGHGHHGFLDFSNERPVLERTKPLPLMRLFHPPYSLAGRKLVSLLLKYL